MKCTTCNMPVTILKGVAKPTGNLCYLRIPFYMAKCGCSTILKFGDDLFAKKEEVQVVFPKNYDWGKDIREISKTTVVCKQ